MCQHGIISEGLLEVHFFRLYVHFIGKECQWIIVILSQGVVVVEASFKFNVFLGLSFISLHNLLCVIDDGFRSQVLCFLFLGLPIVCSTFSSGVFCLEFGPFFFSFLVLFPNVFHLFNYLKDAILGHHMKPLF